MVNKDLH